MNYIWGFVSYFYGEENLLYKHDFVKELVEEFYKRYKMKVEIKPIDLKVLEHQSGIVELVYGKRSIQLTLSFKRREIFTLGGHGMCQIGSKRNKDEFYKVVQMELV